MNIKHGKGGKISVCAAGKRSPAEMWLKDFSLSREGFLT
jgi:hypothetical protein